MGRVCCGNYHALEFSETLMIARQSGYAAHSLPGCNFGFSAPDNLRKTLLHNGYRSSSVLEAGIRRGVFQCNYRLKSRQIGKVLTESPIVRKVAASQRYPMKG